MQKEEKNLIKLSLHISILIATFIFGFLVIGKGFRFDFFKKEKPKETEVVEPEVTSEYLEEQLLIDLKDKVITVDEYFKNLLFAEYDKEYLSNRYYSLKRSEIPLDTDFIASTYVNKITDIILNYYLNRVLLTGITFDVSQENPEEKKGDVVAFADTVYASDFTKKINLNRLVVSGNGNFVIWYTTTGSSAITEGQAREIANELEQSRYEYDKMYNHFYSFKPEFVNEGTIRDAQLKVYAENGISSNYLNNAMQVYVANYTESAAAKYVVGDNIIELYDKFQYGSQEGSIPGPYLLIKASSYNESKERTMQIVNRELFRHYQYNVYCPDQTCLINDDPYYFDAMANYASAVATKKYSYKGFLNDWSAFARNHSGDLLSSEVIEKYGNKNISSALYLYLYFYAKTVPEGNRKIIDALYSKNPFSTLEKEASDKQLSEMIQTMAMEYINQSSSNANLVASPEVESKIKAIDQFDGPANVDEREIEKLGIEYYVLKKNTNDNFAIEFGRGNSKLTCILVGVDNGKYNMVARAPVGDVNVQFNTKNYTQYSEYYIIVANSSILEKNVYSLDIKVN